MRHSERKLPPEAPDYGALVSVEFEDGFDVDSVLAGVADELAGRGYRVAGLIQKSMAPANEEAGDCMELRDLATGLSHAISEERGTLAQGCRLDWHALTEVAQLLENSLNAAPETMPDILIVNRFGRAESEGRGLRGAIEKALGKGVRVIVAVRGEYLAQWNEFHAGLARPVAAEKKPFSAFSDPLGTGRYPVGGIDIFPEVIDKCQWWETGGGGTHAIQRPTRSAQSRIVRGHG